MKCRKIAPQFFVPARRDLKSIVGYATQDVTMQARKRTSNMRQFRVDETLEHQLLFDIGFIIHHLMLGDVERSRFIFSVFVC